jgi:hypothetical protein
MNLAVLPRDRAGIERDLRAGLHALGRVGDELESRLISPADLTGIDAMIRGIGRALTELRIAIDPPRTTA